MMMGVRKRMVVMTMINKAVIAMKIMLIIGPAKADKSERITPLFSVRGNHY